MIIMSFLFFWLLLILVGVIIGLTYTLKGHSFRSFQDDVDEAHEYLEQYKADQQRRIRELQERDKLD